MRNVSSICCYRAAIAALALMLVCTGRTEEGKVVEMEQLRLYVPIPELPRRLGTNVEPLANYVKALKRAAAQCLERAKRPEAKGLLIAVGIGASKNAKFWCQAVDGDCPPELLVKLERALEQVEAITVKSPPMAFGMEMSLWGQKPKKYPEFPESWIEAARKSDTKLLIPPDELFKALWPESAGAPTEVRSSSADFTLQVLEPLGGKIQRPKDWFYTESHRGRSYTWIVSREDASKGPYTTGLRIQMLIGLKEGTGKAAREFMNDFLEKKKKEADKVLKSCPEMKQDPFTRVCLETQEGPHHILYSLFWSKDDADIAVVTIAGTTLELWDTYSSIFDEMNGFELLDAKRFQK